MERPWKRGLSAFGAGGQAGVEPSWKAGGK
jgi:hypothetical protein